MIGVIWRDFMLLLVMSFVAMIVWVLPFINDPQKEEKPGDVPPGNVIAAISWTPGDIDVDLWSIGPGEPRAVGYSNKGGVLFNLLRDDLGHQPDVTPLNFENAYSRGLVEGEYQFNVHCYHCPILPVKVTIEISVNRQRQGEGNIPIATASLELKRGGEEKTAIRFRLRKDGTLVPGSLNSVFKPLRSGTK